MASQPRQGRAACVSLGSIELCRYSRRSSIPAGQGARRRGETLEKSALSSSASVTPGRTDPGRGDLDLDRGRSSARRRRQETGGTTGAASPRCHELDGPAWAGRASWHRRLRRMGIPPAGADRGQRIDGLFGHAAYLGPGFDADQLRQLVVAELEHLDAQRPSSSTMARSVIRSTPSTPSPRYRSALPPRGRTASPRPGPALDAGAGAASPCPSRALHAVGVAPGLSEMVSSKRDGDLAGLPDVHAGGDRRACR